MKSNNFVNKWFRRKKSMKVILLEKNRKIKEHYIIPNLDEITVPASDGTLGRYKFDPERVFLFKNFPTIYLIESNATALDPFDFTSVYDSENYEVAINNKLAREMIKSTEVETKPIMLYLIFGVLALLGVVIFLLLNLGDKITELFPDEELFVNIIWGL